MINAKVDFKALRRINDEIRESQDYYKEPYEFEKKLVEDNGRDLFRYDGDGRCIGIDYENFFAAASRLADEIHERSAAGGRQEEKGYPNYEHPDYLEPSNTDLHGFSWQLAHMDIYDVTK